jgi:hypothetical protein
MPLEGEYEPTPARWVRNQVDEHRRIDGQYGPARDQWWARSVEAYPQHTEYQTNTERQIPVFLARQGR